MLWYSPENATSSGTLLNLRIFKEPADEKLFWTQLHFMRYGGQFFVFSFSSFSKNANFSSCNPLRRLRHPNISPIKGYVYTTDYAILATESSTKGTLRNFLKEQTSGLPLQTVLALAKDVAQALQYLHAQGIVCPILTSHNIVVQDKDFFGNPISPSAVLTDLGDYHQNWSPEDKKSTSNSGAARNRLGSDASAANLRFSDPKLTPRSGAVYMDLQTLIYNYGVLLWEIFTTNLPASYLPPTHDAVFKNAPFETPSMALSPPEGSSNPPQSLDKSQSSHILNAVTSGSSEYFLPHKVPADCPRELANLIYLCWSKHAILRPSLAEIIEVLQTLEQVYVGLSVQTRLEDRVTRTQHTFANRIDNLLAYIAKVGALAINVNDLVGALDDLADAIENASPASISLITDFPAIDSVLEDLESFFPARIIARSGKQLHKYWAEYSSSKRAKVKLEKAVGKLVNLAADLRPQSNAPHTGASSVAKSGNTQNNSGSSSSSPSSASNAPSPVSSKRNTAETTNSDILEASKSSPRPLSAFSVSSTPSSSLSSVSPLASAAYPAPTSSQSLFNYSSTTPNRASKMYSSQVVIQILNDNLAPGHSIRVRTPAEADVIAQEQEEVKRRSSMPPPNLMARTRSDSADASHSASSSPRSSSAAPPLSSAASILGSFGVTSGGMLGADSKSAAASASASSSGSLKDKKDKKSKEKKSKDKKGKSTSEGNVSSQPAVNDPTFIASGVSLDVFALANQSSSAISASVVHTSSSGSNIAIGAKKEPAAVAVDPATVSTDEYLTALVTGVVGRSVVKEIDSKGAVQPRQSGDRINAVPAAHIEGKKYYGEEVGYGPMRRVIIQPSPSPNGMIQRGVLLTAPSSACIVPPHAISRTNSVSANSVAKVTSGTPTSTPNATVGYLSGLSAATAQVSPSASPRTGVINNAKSGGLTRKPTLFRLFKKEPSENFSNNAGNAQGSTPRNNAQEGSKGIVLIDSQPQIIVAQNERRWLLEAQELMISGRSEDIEPAPGSTSTDDGGFMPTSSSGVITNNGENAVDPTGGLSPIAEGTPRDWYEQSLDDDSDETEFVDMTSSVTMIIKNAASQHQIVALTPADVDPSISSSSVLTFNSQAIQRSMLASSDPRAMELVTSGDVFIQAPFSHPPELSGYAITASQGKESAKEVKPTQWAKSSTPQENNISNTGSRSAPNPADPTYKMLNDFENEKFTGVEAYEMMGDSTENAVVVSPRIVAPDPKIGATQSTPPAEAHTSPAEGSNPTPPPRAVVVRMRTTTSSRRVSLVDGLNWDPVAREFWRSNFGVNTNTVPWNRFATALSETILVLPDDMEALRKILDYNEGGYVSASTLAEFLNTHGPLSGAIERMRHYRSEPWFMWYLSHEECVRMMHHADPGNFVVRFSQSSPGTFALTLKHSHGAFMKCLVYAHRGKYKSRPDEEATFDDLLALIRSSSPSLVPFNESWHHQPWFKGTLSAEDSLELINVMPPGAFYVRLPSQASHFVLGIALAPGMFLQEPFTRTSLSDYSVFTPQGEVHCSADSVLAFILNRIKTHQASAQNLQSAIQALPKASDVQEYVPIGQAPSKLR